MFSAVPLVGAIWLIVEIGPAVRVPEILTQRFPEILAHRVPEILAGLS
jgi:hypothetical protein